MSRNTTPFRTRRLEQQIDAYRDGALSGDERAQVRELLESEPTLARHLDETSFLSDVLRDTMNEGPRAPRADFLIASLRPAMAEIDREFEKASPSVWMRSLFTWIAETITPLPAAGLATAAVAALVLTTGIFSEIPTPVPPAVAAISEPAVYDLAQGDVPLMVFEDGDAVVIWMLEEDDRVSAVPSTGGLA